MTLAERIAEETRTMPEQAQQQVLDFALFLKQKEENAVMQDIQSIVTENLAAWKELAK
ncbi:MAG: DUF2281 domain-containing protein [Clostridia bacterium]|nr:DUF2281 domain-containing protein [Clostridia bacterium]MBQ7866096.1 DUF2281 domain-containing protein [Clostridia bacterium]